MKKILIFAILIFSFIGIIFLTYNYLSTKRAVSIPKPIETPESRLLNFLLFLEEREIKLGKDNYKLYVVRNTEDQKIGLSLFDKLKENEGMLFEFENEANHSIWMKNMKFNIDIIFLNKEGMVLEIFENVKKDSYKNDREATIYTSKLPSKYVIEIGEGRARKSGIKPGDVIIIK